MRKYKKEKIRLPTCKASGESGYLLFVDGPRPYINIYDSEEQPMFLEDRNIRKLHNWCNKILRKGKRK